MSDKKEELLKDGEDYAIRRQTPEEIERNDNDEDIPAYRIQMDLDDEQEKRLTEQFKLEFEALEKEREDLGLEAKWRERDSQYDGDIESNKSLPFNLHVHQSRIKVDAICRAAKEAILDVDPIVDVTPRPETAAEKNGYVIAQKQAQFIDYAMDEDIKPEEAYDKVLKSSAKKFVGIAKLTWAYRRDKRKREEAYEGTEEGLRDFLETYPEVKDPNSSEFKKYKSLVMDLIKQKKVHVVTEYKDTTDNNAKIKYVKIEDFYVRNACNYWDGLRTEHFYAEIVPFTYWELLKKKTDNEFKNIEKLWETGDETLKGSENKDYMTATYDAVESVMHFRLKESDEDEVKLKAWFSKDKKTFLGASLFPFYAFDTEYVPHYMILNDEGFYGGAKSIMWTMRDSNIAQNVLLNLALYALYLRNTVTPITTEGSAIEAMFNEKSWEAGKPLVLDELTDDVNKSLSFVQWPNVDTNAFMTIMGILRRDDSDTTTVSDLVTGQESPLDPTAPAEKTMALLHQAGLGIKEYLRTLTPAVNVVCTMILQLYYQMSREGKKYKVRRKANDVVGQDPFETISRDEMIAKTTVQSRASAFAFDKLNEKREAVAGLQLVQTNSYTMQQPAIQYQALLITLQTMGGRWKTLADKMPSPEAFQQQQLETAVQAMQMLMQNAQAKSQITNVPPRMPSPEESAAAVTKAQAVRYNPALADPEGAKK